MRRKLLTLGLALGLGLVPGVVGLMAPAMAVSEGTTSWTVYDYNPSGQALAPRVSANSMPATTSGNTASFPFKPNTYTALLTTSDRSLTGDLTGKTLNDTIKVTGVTGTFQDQNNGGCSPDTKTVRFHFTSPTAGGTTGFFTQFWWSNPVSVPLTTNGSTPISASLTPTLLSTWSDWNGQGNTSRPAVAEAFADAVKNVQTVGLSFGGGCFFENGVTTSYGSGVFSSAFSES